MAAGEVLKLGFHCLGLLKQRWTPSQFYTKHCLLSPQRSLSLEPKKKSIFSSKRTASRPMARLEQSSTGGETRRENYTPKKRLLGEQLTPAAHVGSSGQTTW